MTRAAEYLDTSLKKGGRGRAKKSLDLIEAMTAIAEAAQPITGRGVGYKLFTAGLIPSMSRSDMQRVYRLLKEAREDGIIPWHWIVDETRDLEREPSWDDPDEFARAASRQYRRDFWSQQPERCEVWSEKGTVRGVIAPVLDEYGVGFRVMHGFTSATNAHDIALDNDGRPLTALYVGDWDPSGLCMSERDLPARFEKYDGDHVLLHRITLVQDDLANLPSFPASDKRTDPRYKWYIQKYGDRCWEVDALDPNELRDRVEAHIRISITDTGAWQRSERVNKAERESLQYVLSNWAGRASGRRQ